MWKANSKLTKNLYKAGEFDPLLCPSMITNCPRSTLPVKTLKPNLVLKKKKKSVWKQKGSKKPRNWVQMFDVSFPLEVFANGKRAVSRLKVKQNSDLMCKARTSYLKNTICQCWYPGYIFNYKSVWKRQMAQYKNGQDLAAMSQ